jgi:histidine phosphotransfer protein HptB
MRLDKLWKVTDMGLDQNALSALRALDPNGADGLLEQIIASYLSDAATLIQQITRASAAHDIASLQRHAHSLKSTSLTVGASRVSAIARELELACKQGAINVLPMFVTALGAEYSAAERLLQVERNVLPAQTA